MWDSFLQDGESAQTIKTKPCLLFKVILQVKEIKISGLSYQLIFHGFYGVFLLFSFVSRFGLLFKKCFLQRLLHRLEIFTFSPFRLFFTCHHNSIEPVADNVYIFLKVLKRRVRERGGVRFCLEASVCVRVLNNFMDICHAQLTLHCRI